MLQLYPENAISKLEFDKIQQLLLNKCTTDGARKRAAGIRFLSQYDKIERALKQTREMLDSLASGDYFPSTTIRNLEKELRILSIPRSCLQVQELTGIKELCKNINAVFKWFKGRKELFPFLFSLIENTAYEPAVLQLISRIINEQNQLRDDASDDLTQIRKNLSEIRQKTRKSFESNLRKLSKLGYLSDISETFLNGRRCVAVFAEQKRIVKGILHGESDSGKTVFIEPENTVALNNEIVLLESEERKEIRKILQEITAQLAVYEPVLNHYYRLCGIFDFIRAKSLLAKDMDAALPLLNKKPIINLQKAVHPILFLKNKLEEKPTIPLNITLDEQQRILMISGPNAGGKTVAMKTIGLLQLMFQAGLLVPISPDSEMGVFQQVMVHIGDTQSIENELSTYSAHLKDMNYFIRFANGKSLFFIDELGSGSDPYLGGTFAEAIVEELVRKHAFGVITTHYLNLKIMAGKTKGMTNAAMLFDEQRLLPLFRLETGKPGSSYTFAIAQRSGLPEKIIDRARKLTDENHLRLDKLLLEVEQQSVQLEKKAKRLEKQLVQSKSSQEKYERLAQKEAHQQQLATLKLQNQIKQEELEYLRDTERKFRQLIQEWKKTENKQEVIHAAEQLLFRKKHMKQNAAAAKKADKKYKALSGQARVGSLVRHKKNHQIGRVEQINDKNAIIRIGKLPFTVNLEEWIPVEEKDKKVSK